MRSVRAHAIQIDGVGIAIRVAWCALHYVQCRQGHRCFAAEARKGVLCKLCTQGWPVLPCAVVQRIQSGLRKSCEIVRASESAQGHRTGINEMIWTIV